MKSMVCAAAVVAMSVSAFAQTSAPLLQGNRIPNLVPTCAAGFNYSAKEQFAPTHLWFICKTPPIRCPQALPGGISVNDLSTPPGFRFSYECKTLAPVPAGTKTCAAGFTPEIGSVVKLQADSGKCITPVVTCPQQFAAMSHSALQLSGAPAAVFEYQCYRP